MDRTAWKLRSFNRRRARFGEDLCDLIDTAMITDGSNGQTLSTATVASNLRCFVEQLSGSSQEVASGLSFNRTHRVTVETTTATRAITGDYQIKVLARGDNAQMIFEQPIISKNSYSPLTTVLCIYTEGHRQPGLV